MPEPTTMSQFLCQGRSARTTPALALALAGALAGCGENLSQPPSREAASGSPPVELSCLPNLDGRIDAAELEPALGVPARYVVTPPGLDRAVDLAGRDDPDYGKRWDLTIDYADDQALELAPSALGGAWYSPYFPEGAFVTPFDAGGRLDSVLRTEADGLYLLGLVSHAEAPPEGVTRLVYEPPIRVLPFPIEVGVSYVSVGQISNGLVQGLPYAGQDTYQVSVDGEGATDLPQLLFTHTHRVRTVVTVVPAVGASTVRRQTSFFAECFGEVARASSLAEEPLDDFTTADELRRLGF
jgi:hypothetical protein